MEELEQQPEPRNETPADEQPESQSPALSVDELMVQNPVLPTGVLPLDNANMALVDGPRTSPVVNDGRV